MDRQIRLQNQKRFAKSMHSTPSQPIQRPAPDDLTLPPRKPPVPRFSKIKKRRSKSAIQDEKTEDEAPHPAPRLRRKKLDALRRERVQQSVALARKNGKKESTSHNQQQNDVSITELLLGFQQSPQ
ncbi:unnamed protein product [Aphanomyces euteiches]